MFRINIAAPTGLHRRVSLGIILLELFCLCLAKVYTFFLPGRSIGGVVYRENQRVALVLYRPASTLGWYTLVKGTGSKLRGQAYLLVWTVQGPPPGSIPYDTSRDCNYRCTEVEWWGCRHSRIVQGPAVPRRSPGPQARHAVPELGFCTTRTVVRAWLAGTLVHRKEGKHRKQWGQNQSFTDLWSEQSSVLFLWQLN